MSLCFVSFFLLNFCFHLIKSEDWSCTDDSGCTRNCHSDGDCICDECNTDDWICRDSVQFCTFNCLEPDSCKNVEIYSDAEDTVINCEAPNSCDGLIVYCGYPPHWPSGGSWDFKC